MKRLNKELVQELISTGKSEIKSGPLSKLPEKVLQFGEGNFLRGFVDWMINELNGKGLFNGSVVVVPPIPQHMLDPINEQDGLYTLLLRGIQNGEVVEKTEIISSISRGVDLYKDHEAYLAVAESPELRVVISNTTEAGIYYNPKDKLEAAPQDSYPAKLTALLYKRFVKFGGDPSKGLLILPCELIDRNGDNLKNYVLKHSQNWGLGADFIKWVEESNVFFNTLVDRIVTGYPRDEIKTITENLGYEDKVVDTGEIFHLWVIEGDAKYASELPFTEAGLEVIWTNDMTPYRSRKVRILNGAHTMTVLLAYLYGRDTVGECMDDTLIRAYMTKGIYEEVIPTLDLPLEELNAFAASVFERFSNPFIKHFLLSIALNSVSKFKARVLPSVLEYYKRKETLPPVLTASLASLFAFYKGTAGDSSTYLNGNRNGEAYKIQDEENILNVFKDLWANFDGSAEGTTALVTKLLAREDWWGQDLNSLPGFTAAVAGYLGVILNKSPEALLKELTQ